MARVLFNPGRYTGNSYANDLAVLDSRITDIRNRLRTALDPGSTGNTWKVSDIVKWTGVSSFVAYAFVVQHRDGAGTPTGKEWLFLFSGANTGEAAYFQSIFGLNNSTNCSNYWRNSTGGTDFNFAAKGTWSVHYNDKLSYAMDLQASANSGSPVASEAVQVQGDASRAGTLTTITAADNWIVTQSSGAKFKPGDILEAPGSGATFTVSAINDDRFYDMGFDDFAAMTLAGGDLSVPGSNPYSEHTTFMPSQELLRGLCMGRPYNAVHPTFAMWVFDDTKPFFAWYMTDNKHTVVRTIGILGDIVETFKGPGQDDNKSASWVFRLISDFQQTGLVEGYNLECYYGDHPGGTGAARDAFNYRVHAQFTQNNSPRESDGQYPFELVTIDNANEFKGNFDPQVIMNVGVYNDDYMRVFDGGDGPLVKYERHLAFPWVEASPLFPPIHWDSEPDDSLLSE